MTSSAEASASASTSKGKFSTSQFFETQEPPAGLKAIAEQVGNFVEKQRQSGRKVVLVTVSSQGIAEVGDSWDIEWLELRRKGESSREREGVRGRGRER